MLKHIILISVFFQALVAEQESKDSGGASIAEQVLSIMEIILDEANAEISEDKVSIEGTFSPMTALYWRNLTTWLVILI